MQNMGLLLSKTPKSDIQTHVLPMIFRALEADSPQIQVQVISALNLVQEQVMLTLTLIEV